MFFFNNVERCHWNFVVIYPKLQVIELIDSYTVNNDSINKLKTVWEFLWRYCRDKKIGFDAKKWKIFIQDKASFMKVIISTLVTMLFYMW